MRSRLQAAACSRGSRPAKRRPRLTALSPTIASAPAAITANARTTMLGPLSRATLTTPPPREFPIPDDSRPGRASWFLSWLIVSLVPYVPTFESVSLIAVPENFGLLVEYAESRVPRPGVGSTGSQPQPGK